jgi:hypothetical protein
LQAVVATGESVVLVEEGQTLADGSRVVEVTLDVVKIQSRGGQPTDRVSTPESQMKGLESHPSSLSSTGAGLLLNQAMHDNRGQPRK